MKRLIGKLLSMENNTATYTEMYEGTVLVVSVNGQAWTDKDNRYFKTG